MNKEELRDFEAVKDLLDQEILSSLRYYISQQNIEITSVENDRIKMNVTVTPCIDNITLDFSVMSDGEIIDNQNPDLVALGLH